MATQASPMLAKKDQSEPESVWDLISIALYLIAVIAVIGAIIPAVFWGIWYAFFDSIPKFWGHSRLLLDTISGPFYALILAAYIGVVVDKSDELSGDGEFKVSFGEFVIENPPLSAIGLLLIIDFIASIFFSFAAGLAVILALALVVGIYYGLWKSLKIIFIFSLLFLFGQTFGPQTEEE